ncbi:MAG: OstA-like protein, partial [Flavobacteriales bacterium]
MNFCRYILLLFLLSSLPGILRAQGGKVILMRHADRLEYDTSINSAQRLNGNVEFQHGAVIMYCDSAWFFPKRNYLNAFGHVHVKQGDSLNLYGDSLRYDGNTRIAKLRGNIRMVEKDLRLITDSIDFNVKKG